MLPRSELRDQIVPVIHILRQCIKAEIKINNDEVVKEIIDHIGLQLDRIYMKKYSAIRLRSRSDGLLMKKKLTSRKLSVCVEDGDRSAPTTANKFSS